MGQQLTNILIKSKNNTTRFVSFKFPNTVNPVFNDHTWDQTEKSGRLKEGPDKSEIQTGH